MERVYFYKKITNNGKIGEVTNDIIENMKDYGIQTENFEKIRMVLFEAEKNIKLYAQSGEIEVHIEKDNFNARFKDKGPGIPNIELAFKDGYSTADEKVKDMGYGLGKGLNVIQSNTDNLNIASEIGVGTTVDIQIRL